MEEVLSVGEKKVMHMTVKSTLLRAADIIEHITDGDVLDMQAKMLRQGVSLTKVAKLDRAMIAAAHLRAVANKPEGGF